MALGKIWVYAEAAEGAPTSTTLEMLTKARELADSVDAFYVGPDGASLAGRLGEYGAGTLYTLDPGSVLTGAVAAASLAQLIGEHSPELVLFAQSYAGRDTLAHLSVKLDATVITNGTDLEVEGDTVRVGTAIFGGNVLVTTEFTAGGTRLAGIRPKSFEPASAGGGAATVVEAPAVDVGREGEAQVLESHVEASEGPKLEDATIVVSGGRGLGAAENYHLVDELAALLKGASGATRAIVDAGWVPYSKQVGQTGKVVKPRVYIALGISGATQHMVGMKGSDNIIAVNKDEEAPIFSIADLGIVGDVHKVLPKLIEALKGR
jgi:electron transfer flavoprotein alpha subunit